MSVVNFDNHYFFILQVLFINAKVGYLSFFVIGAFFESRKRRKY